MTVYDTSKAPFHIYSCRDDTICARELSETIAELQFQVDYLAFSTALHVIENGTAEFEKNILMKSGDEASMRLINAIEDPHILEIADTLYKYADGWHNTIMSAAQKGRWSMLTIPNRMPVFEQTENVYLKLQAFIDWLRETGNMTFADVFESKRKLSSKSDKTSKDAINKTNKSKTAKTVKNKASTVATATNSTEFSTTDHERSLTKAAFDNMPDSGFVREKQLIASEPGGPSLLPFSSSTLWRKANAGKFPKPIKITDRITGWSVKEIREWLATKTPG